MRRLYVNTIVIILMLALLSGCADFNQNASSVDWLAETQSRESAAAVIPGVADVYAVSDNAYMVLNDNLPLFTEEEITTKSFEQYAELDDLGRCQVAFACVGTELMPTEERGAIGMIKPSGWHTVKYDFIDGNYLYNRCHLIGYQLTGENANEKNLITGTRYLNTEGMLPFENLVANYVLETGNHVMYRVTPVFEGDNLLAHGVQMEAWSVEDQGEGVCFHVFVYNIQPGVRIDYATGESQKTDTVEVNADGSADCMEEVPASTNGTAEVQEYMLNTNTMKFHLPWCSSIDKMSEHNKESYQGSREWLVENGYTPCGRCKP